MRRQDDQNLGVYELFVVVGEKVFDERYLSQAGPSVVDNGFIAFDQATQDVHFAFFESNIVFHGALANDGLADAADG